MQLSKNPTWLFCFTQIWIMLWTASAVICSLLPPSDLQHCSDWAAQIALQSIFPDVTVSASAGGKGFLRVVNDWVKIALPVSTELWYQTGCAQAVK